MVPGSHRWADAYEASTRREMWKDGIYAEKSYPSGVHEDLTEHLTLAPGSAVTVLGTTVHGAGANTSADVCRRGLIVQYCVGWVRSTHSNLLLYPPDFAKTLPEPVQRLVGYQLEAKHCGQLEAKHCGQLEQGVDPITLLRDWVARVRDDAAYAWMCGRRMNGPADADVWALRFRRALSPGGLAKERSRTRLVSAVRCLFSSP